LHDANACGDFNSEYAPAPGLVLFVSEQNIAPEARTMLKKLGTRVTLNTASQRKR
jgi:hypothetical protein